MSFQDYAQVTLTNVNIVTLKCTKYKHCLNLDLQHFSLNLNFFMANFQSEKKLTCTHLEVRKTVVSTLVKILTIMDVLMAYNMCTKDVQGFTGILGMAEKIEYLAGRLAHLACHMS